VTLYRKRASAASDVLEGALVGVWRQLTLNFAGCYKTVPRISADPEGKDMNKTDLIDHIAIIADISKASATRALDAVIEGIADALRKDDVVTLVGFGSFYVGTRAARSGRNPRTGAVINIKAAKVPKFRPGKGLKDAIN
jgi:DNA-binding protein HU-beta